jgi:hypothetical protein
MKSLPVGQQSIEKILKNDYTYVDKTEILHKLIQKPDYFFLSRPRRFGKSLTCDTLEAIFKGRKKLFEGLAISKLDYDWKVYPVVRLDFNEILHNDISSLNKSLTLALKLLADEYHIALDLSYDPADIFKLLIIELAKKYGPVAVIIDEYDKPILDHIGDMQMAEKMRRYLKSFYGILKGKSVEANLRFLFITGVSKFSKISIFSELNNLNDLTLDEKVATLCGYTQEELELVFNEHIDQLAKHIGRDKNTTLEDLKKWYNGFQFSKSGAKVYNPLSILNCLDKNDFANYWFASGTPTFILKFIEKNPAKVNEIITLDSERITVGQMDSLSLERYYQDMVLLFLQSGYLTIAEFDEKSQIYQLSYPNYEVRLSMTNQILEFVANISPVKLSDFVVRFKDALQADDINTFCQAMKDFFVLIPHTVVVNLEKFYHGMFFTIAKLIGAKITVEDATNIGFIDAVLEGKCNTYVIEFKRDKTPDEALKQIQDKKYFEKFAIEGDKPIVLIGMNFDFDENNKDDKSVKLDWKIKRL